MSDSYTPRIGGLLLLAGLVTAIVTAVRVVGEIQGWEPEWFSREAGGGFPGVDIVWLVPLFGFLFGRRLAQSGSKPPFIASFFVPMFGVAVIVAAVALILAPGRDEDQRANFQYLVNGAPIVALLALFAWPRACFVNLAYAVLARASVIGAQYWMRSIRPEQTHYGKLHPDLPPVSGDERMWVLMQVEVGVWIPLTVLLGGAFAALGAATVRKA